MLVLRWINWVNWAPSSRASWQDDCSYLNRQHRQSAIYGAMVRMDLWCWLISHGVSRNQTGKSTTFLFNFISRKILEQMEEDYTGS